ncbi:MAG: HD domain-containing protein [Planctomycetes bacterium]|nr:HD domain-containing protein [Planctomycetota bacterium]
MKQTKRGPARRKRDIGPLLRAVLLAARKHRAQLRKDRETPYVAHPLRVAMILEHVFGVSDLDMLAAAVLHDTIEDTQTDHDDLVPAVGRRAADLVAALTKDKRMPEAAREEAFLAQLVAAGPEAMVIKLADIYDNLLDAGDLAASDRRKTVAKARKQWRAFEGRLGPEWNRVKHAFRSHLTKMARAPAAR